MKKEIISKYTTAALTHLQEPGNAALKKGAKGPAVEHTLKGKAASFGPSVISIGVRMVRFLIPTYIIYIFIELLSAGLRAMGDTFVPMILSCGGVCGSRFLWTLVIFPLHPTIEMLELNYPVSWAITLGLFVIYYFRKRKRLMPDLA